MITGKYVFKSNGEIIAEKENLITTSGIDIMNKYLAQSVQDWAGSIAVGALYSAPAITDQRLAYEISRSQVTLKSYGTYSGSNQITLKASIDPTVTASIFEIGVIPQNFINTDNKDNFYITSFDELYGSTASLNWFVGAKPSSLWYQTTSGSSRVGSYNLYVPTSGSMATASGLFLDVSKYNQNDYMQLLYYVPAVIATAPSVVFTLQDSASNTWTSSVITLNTAAQGYYSASIKMTNAPQTNFTYLVDTLTASFIATSGAGSVYFDNLKFISGGTLNQEQMLLSRSASTTAFVVTKYGQPLEIEYTVTVT